VARVELLGRLHEDDHLARRVGEAGHPVIGLRHELRRHLAHGGVEALGQAAIVGFERRDRVLHRGLAGLSVLARLLLLAHLLRALLDRVALYLAETLGGFRLRHSLFSSLAARRGDMLVTVRARREWRFLNPDRRAPILLRLSRASRLCRRLVSAGP